MPSIQIITKEDNKISIKLKGISLHHANALRRICLNGVPIFAIDTVDIMENSSILPDEGLTHTLGMIPLKTEFDGLDEFCDHYLAKINELPIGAARIREEKKGGC